jgi:hypothetical protein
VWPAPGLAPGFDQIGWRPEGNVFFQYTIATNAAPPAASTEWAASAQGDLDGNAALSSFGYIHPLPGAPAATIAGPGCVVTGIYNPATTLQDQVNTVGPCDNVSGQSVF